MSCQQHLLLPAGTWAASLMINIHLGQAANAGACSGARSGQVHHAVGSADVGTLLPWAFVLQEQGLVPTCQCERGVVQI
jgi:hypothetical protein